jgi:hypothetical protein
MRLEARNIKKFWKKEVPSGTIGGGNKVFTLSQTPVESDSVTVYLNGLRQTPTIDYTISTITVTFVTAPALGQVVTCDYVQLLGGE